MGISSHTWEDVESSRKKLLSSCSSRSFWGYSISTLRECCTGILNLTIYYWPLRAMWKYAILESVNWSRTRIKHRQSSVEPLLISHQKCLEEKDTKGTNLIYGVLVSSSTLCFLVLCHSRLPTWSSSSNRSSTYNAHGASPERYLPKPYASWKRFWKLIPTNDWILNRSWPSPGSSKPRPSWKR